MDKIRQEMEYTKKSNQMKHPINKRASDIIIPLD